MMGEIKTTCRSALEREARLLEFSIERTREALVVFEKRHRMTSAEFERKFKTKEIDEINHALGYPP